MTVEIRLRVPKTDVLVQEDLVGLVEVVNVGREPVAIPRLGFARGVPAFRVTNVSSGVETIHERPSMEGDRDWPWTLRAGESVEVDVDLLEHVPLYAPGEYDLSALFSYEHEKRTVRIESPAVRVRIRPSSPRNVSVDSIQGYVAFGAWLGLGGDTPEVVVGKFRFVPGGGVRVVGTAGSADIHARPVLSLYPNGTFADGQWVAWTEGSAFRCAHFHPQAGVQPGPKVDLAAHAEIVAPLHSEAPQDPAVPPTGSALLWVGDPRLPNGRLQGIRFLPSQAALGAALELRGEHPTWMANHVRSSGSRSAFFVQEEGKGVRLATVGWTDASILPPVALSEWSESFVAAGSTLDLEDTVHAAVLLRCAGAGLKLVSMEVDPRGTFRTTGTVDVPWDAKRAIGQAVLRVGATGVACAALCDRRGQWSLIAEGRVEPFPREFRNTDRAVEIAFLADFYPVLILAVPGGGLRLVMPDGSPLPRRTV